MAGRDSNDAAFLAQTFPPVAMKNIAAERALRTMRQVVRKGKLDFTVSR